MQKTIETLIRYAAQSEEALDTATKMIACGHRIVDEIGELLTTAERAVDAIRIQTKGIRTLAQGMRKPEEDVFLTARSAVVRSTS